MGVKTSLKDLAVALGSGGASTTVDGLISEIAVALNPLAGLALDTDIDAETDLLGKTVDDLQSGVSIRNNTIYGTLFYQDDYTGFSGDEELQSGYYVVLHAEVPNTTGTTITISKNGGTPKTLDSDGILILRVTNKTLDTVTYAVTKSGATPFTRTYNLKGLEFRKA